jgi:hypothetical protein
VVGQGQGGAEGRWQVVGGRAAHLPFQVLGLLLLLPMPEGLGTGQWGLGLGVLQLLLGWGYLHEASTSHEGGEHPSVSPVGGLGLVTVTGEKVLLPHLGVR